MRIFFITPFFDLVSNHVRAETLKGYEPPGVGFVIFKPILPRVLLRGRLRILTELVWYAVVLFFLKKKDDDILYFIKPTSPTSVRILKTCSNLKAIIDVNDPYHLPQFLGEKRTTKLLTTADAIIFESIEYSKRYPQFAQKSHVIEDTPQHECIYLNYRNRLKRVIWIGSRHTASSLINFADHFKMFNRTGYAVLLLGATQAQLGEITGRGVEASTIEAYDFDLVESEASRSQISFVPMESDDLHNLRGNLKAKLSMGLGCFTVCSNLEMHRRLIINGVNGLLFSDLRDFEKSVHGYLTDEDARAACARRANEQVATEFTRAHHAEELTRAASSLKKILT